MGERFVEGPVDFAPRRELDRGGDPDRAVEGAGEEGGEDRGDLLGRAPTPPTFESLTPTIAQAPSSLARSASVGVTTLSSAAIGIGLSAATCASLHHRRHRLLGELDVEGLDLGEHSLRLLDAPGPVGVDPDPRHRVDRRPHRPHLADVVAAGAELQLEGAESGRGPAFGVGRDRRRLAGDERRVAARVARLFARPARRVRLAVAGRRARSRERSAPAPRAPPRAPRAPLGPALPPVASSSSRTTSASVVPPRSESGTASPSPTRPSSSRSRSSTISRCVSVPARGHVRLPGTAARRG